MLVFETRAVVGPKYIINFPTKQHWRGKSRIEDIETGLAALVAEVEGRGIRSIAVPPLGCGLGGLRWEDVRPRILRAFERVPQVTVQLFAPLGAPEAKKMPVRTAQPQMTAARALVIELMHRYLRLAYRLTLLEIQKLAYFLQEAGEPLKLKYEAGRYGPYATNLNKVLERIEGHFTRGFGDSPDPDRDLELLPGALEMAAAWLRRQPESYDRLERVSELIEGFETPYGMELLSSVHWVAVHAKPPAVDQEMACDAVYAWNERKRQMFHADDITVAWTRLVDAGWLTGKA
jgi:O-acetyl-ADP-ribose deacetylase (regulator of RNase III)